MENWIVSPPYDFYTLTKEKRKEASWLKINHHGLKWDDGVIAYDAFLKELKFVCSKAGIVYMKGREKCEFIRTLLNVHVVDLFDFGTPNLKNLLLDDDSTSCYRHRYHHVCSMRIVNCLRDWIFSNDILCRVDPRGMTIRIAQPLDE